MKPHLLNKYWAKRSKKLATIQGEALKAGMLSK